MSRTKKLLSLLLAIIMLTAILAGCGNQGQGSDKEVLTSTDNTSIQSGKTPTEGEKANAEPVKLSFFAPEFAVYEEKKDEVVKEIEKRNNVEIKFMSSAVDAWKTKINLLMASNEAPDVFKYDSPADFANFIEQGLVLPLDQYIEKTTKLKELVNIPGFKNLKTDGKVYFIPGVTEIAAQALYVRQDWMEKLGIAPPKTLDEFKEMLRKFTEEDPDGDGKRNTVGMSANNNFMTLAPFYHAYNAVDGWNMEEDGMYNEAFFTEKFRSGLLYLRELYEKGYLEKEFFLNNDNMLAEKFQTGKIGCMVNNSTWAVKEIVEKLQQVNPNAKVTFIEPPAGPNGEQGVFGLGGYYGMWAVSKDCKNPQKAVDFFEFLLTPEGQKLKKCGIEGRHYKEEGDKIVPLVENRLADTYGLETFGKDGKQNFHWEGWFPEYRIEEGKAIVIKDFSNAKYPELEKMAYDISSKYAELPEAVNVSWPKEVISLYGRVWGDIVDTSYKVISSKTKEEADKAWQDYMNKLNDKGLDAVRKIATELVKKLKAE